jgi:hypothetical protein
MTWAAEALEHNQWHLTGELAFEVFPKRFGYRLHPTEA